jgi:DNA-binding CsgD family transcriptional regulator
VSSVLPLSEAAINRLRKRGLIRRQLEFRAKRQLIDCAALQQTYARLLAEGGFSSNAELARHLDVSRVWVSRVLKGIKRRSS